VDGNSTFWSIGVVAPTAYAGRLNINATLLDSVGNTLHNVTESIEIAKHPTNVTLALPTIVGDTAFTVSGRVTDSLSGSGIQDAAVSIGLGSAGGSSQQRLGDAATGVDGTYTASVTLPERMPNDPAIFIIYGGDELYLPSETLSPIETELDVPVVREITVGNQTVLLEVSSNSEVSPLVLDEESRALRFDVVGAEGTEGETTIEIGKILEGPYTVFIDGEPTRDFTLSRDDSTGLQSLTVRHPEGASEIEVQGVRVVPEFPLLIGLIFATALVPIVLKRLRIWPPL
jgi:hypothetical protein